MRPIHLALSVWKNRRGAVPRPSWCTYLVTYRCNARCRMCDSWRMKPGDELTPEEVETVFHKIGRLDVVRLSGGEPFLREDLPAIAEAACRQSSPMVLHVTTNGSFPDRVVEFARRFSKPRRLRFMVSFDGMREEHDRNRGKDVTFDLATETVSRLADLRDSLGLKVSVNHTVISPRSLDDNGKLRDLFKRRGVDVHSVLAYADSSMYGVKLRGKRADHLIVPTEYPLHPMLAGADVTGFVERELERVGEYDEWALRVGKNYYLQGLLERLHHEERPRKPPCVALRSHLRLLPDASVPVCQFNTEKVGNLLRQSFEEVWSDDETRRSREWVDACPGCWAECEVMPSALYTADLLTRLLQRRRPTPDEPPA